jgi:hypothetical protein
MMPEALTDFRLADGPADRTVLFNRYWAALAARGGSSVVLHSWKELPETIESDIDYAVAGVSARDLLGFLAEFSRSLGWRLVQVIEHEPNAFFCVCMQYGGDFEVLALDVTWDYRRLGHLLVPSWVLHEGSRQVEGKAFRVPAPGAEATYILAKAAAKGKAFEEVKPRLLELFQDDAVGCCRSLTENLGFAGVVGDSPGQILAEVERWFPEAPAFRQVRKGRRLGMDEILLYLRRSLRPTGLWLRFHGKHSDPKMIDRIVEPLIPLFRRTIRCNHVSRHNIPLMISKVIRTSLIIESDGGSGESLGGGRIVVNLSQVSDVGDARCRILDQMAARIEKRFAERS